MSEREMEFAEYLKAMKPHHIREVVIQNGRLMHERAAFKTTIAALSGDNREMTKNLDRTQARCTALLEETRQLKFENRTLKAKLGLR